MESDRVRRVTWGRNHDQPQVTDDDIFLRAECGCGTRELGVEGADRRVCALGERVCSLGMIGVPMGQQHDTDVSVACVDGVEDRLTVAGVVRTRVDDDALARTWLRHDPCVGAVQGHGTGVGCEHASDPGRHVGLLDHSVTASIVAGAAARTAAMSEQSRSCVKVVMVGGHIGRSPS